MYLWHMCVWVCVRVGIGVEVRGQPQVLVLTFLPLLHCLLLCAVCQLAYELLRIL